MDKELEESTPIIMFNAILKQEINKWAIFIFILGQKDLRKQLKKKSVKNLLGKKLSGTRKVKMEITYQHDKVMKRID